MNFNYKKHKNKIFSLLILILVISFLSIETKETSIEDKIYKCLSYNSNEKVDTCITLISLEKSKNSVNFPNSNLVLENINIDFQTDLKNYNPKISGTIENTYNKPAYIINLRIDFYKGEESTPFHYEVFSPFDNEETQIQPNSKKSFSKMLIDSTITKDPLITQNLPVKGIVTVYESKIHP